MGGGALTAPSDPGSDTPRPPRTYRASRFVLAYLALSAALFAFLTALLAFFTLRRGASSDGLVVLLVVLLLFAVPMLALVLMLLRGALRVTTVPARDGGVLALTVWGVAHRDFIPVDELRSVRTSWWDLGGLFPVVRHARGSVRLLAVGERETLARALLRERPDLEIWVQSRPGAARNFGLGMAAIGAVLGAIAIAGGGDLRAGGLAVAGSLVIVGAFIALISSVTPRPGKRAERVEGALARVGGQRGAALRQGRGRALTTLVAVVGLFTAWVVLDIARPPGQALLHQPWFIGLIVVMAITAPLALVSALRGGIGLVLTTRGLDLTGYWLRPISAAWEELRDVRLASTIGRTVVRIDVDQATRSRWPLGWRALSWPSRRLTHADITLSPQLMGVDPEALLAWIEHYRSHPEARPELGVSGLERLAAIESALRQLR